MTNVVDNDPFAPLPDEVDISIFSRDLIPTLANRYRFVLSMFYLRSRSPLAIVYFYALIKIRAQLETAIEIDHMNGIITDKE